MIDIRELDISQPYTIFKDYYDLAFEKSPRGLEAIVIASMDKELDEVDSRFVNLKYIIKDEWIFFSNYNSPKSKQFESHKQISAIFFWPSINIQIRIKAVIFKTSESFSNNHFLQRSKSKNALAMSSNQSQIIDSYDQVKKNYMEALDLNELDSRPSYWGGFSFKPYSFEFWEGHNSRLNKRDLYEMKEGAWRHSFLQP
tara:strand:- start:285 stop:881 length:597 start_codon:yes stop_codon:yes gene_type:complete